MFFFRHPRPVIDGRAVAVQVVQQKTQADMNLKVLVIPEAKPAKTNDTVTAEIS